MNTSRLTPIRFVGKNKHKQDVWLYACSCGKEITAVAASVKCGHTSSCGCLRLERAASACTRHGLSKHKLYKVHTSLKGRCFNKNNQSFRYYGGRGITVCKEWKDSFNVFFEWAMSNGWEEGLDLDRKDNDGDYCPENCRFVTRRINLQNKRQLSIGKVEFIGVGQSKSGKKFRAKYSYKGKSVHVGYFNTALEASIARDKEVARLNESYMVSGYEY